MSINAQFIIESQPIRVSQAMVSGLGQGCLAIGMGFSPSCGIVQGNMPNASPGTYKLSQLQQQLLD